MFETLVFATLRILYMLKQLEVVLHDPFKLIKGDCKDFTLLQNIYISIKHCSFEFSI